MTRAKSKPSIPTREPARAPRAAAPVEKPRPSPPRLPEEKGAANSKAKRKPASKATPPPAIAEQAGGRRSGPAVKPGKAPAATAPREKAPPKKSVPSKSAAVVAPAPKPASGRSVQRRDPPAKLRPIEQAVGVSSDAVLRRTGKSWAEWFALLDAAGAAEFDHKGIVAVLAQRHGVGPWWQQMVTVAYEQARGKTGKQANEDGFQVDVVKTLELPLAKLYRFWSEPAERNKWLADDRFSVHKATASKSIRARWGRGSSRIDVEFCEKGPARAQVTVQHNRIESSEGAEQMKAYWAKKISALEALITNG